MTIAKGLSSGYQPIGAVMVSDRIASVIDQEGREFTHGYTYSGHPAACAAGLAMMDIISNDRLFERAEALSGYFQDSIWSALEGLDSVTDIRSYGMMVGVDVRPGEKPGVSGFEAQKALYNAGLHVKFTGDAGIVAPPFIAEHEHIDELCDKLREVLKTF